MSQPFERLLLLHDESVRQCRIIMELLQDERLALIALDTQKVSEILLQKEHHVSSLENTRGKIFDVFTKEFKVQNPEAFEAVLSPEQRTKWHSARAEWQSEWGKVSTLGMQNQRFLKHSMKNLARFADHLKQLLGEPGRYSSSGDKIDSSSEGRVLETNV